MQIQGGWHDDHRFPTQKVTQSSCIADRRVMVWLEEKQPELVLLTNRFDLAAETIAEIYKQRW